MEGISTLTNQGIQFRVECFYLWDVERDVPGATPRGVPEAKKPAAQAVGCVQSGGGEEHTRGTALRLVYPICYKSPETSAL
jgi:hypothetical protein